MKNSDTAEAETMTGAFQTGYSRKQVIQSIVLALALHAAVVGAYLVLGSEKKPPQGKVAAKEEKKDGDAKAPSTAPDAKSDAPKVDASAAGTGDAAKAPDKPKGAEASKASELPAAPDSDIDAILKSK